MLYIPMFFQSLMERIMKYILAAFIIINLAGCKKNPTSAQISEKMHDFYACSLLLQYNGKLPDHMEELFMPRLAKMRDKTAAKLGTCSAADRKILFEIAQCRLTSCEAATKISGSFDPLACEKEMQSGDAKLSKACRQIARSLLITFLPNTPEEMKEFKSLQGYK
jgi:hypothetical protein